MKYKLLIVDDEEEVREFISERYKLMGMEIYLAQNGKEAIEILSKEKINIVISDILMPVMNGIELMKVIRNEYSMVKAIMITGHVDLQNALNCYRYGAFNIIFKPFNNFDELDESIEEIKLHLSRWQNKLSALVKMKPKAVSKV